MTLGKFFDLFKPLFLLNVGNYKTAVRITDNLLIDSFREHLLLNYHGSGTVLGTGDKAKNKADKVSSFHGTYRGIAHQEQQTGKDIVCQAADKGFGEEGSKAERVGILGECRVHGEC